MDNKDSTTPLDLPRNARDMTLEDAIAETLDLYREAQEFGAVSIMMRLDVLHLLITHAESE